MKTGQVSCTLARALTEEVDRELVHSQIVNAIRDAEAGGGLSVAAEGGGEKTQKKRGFGTSV